MSEADVIGLLGERSIERFHAHLGEGFCAPGSRVFPDSPAEIEIVWRDSTYSGMAALTVRHHASPWHTPQGIRVGSTVEELERIAGAPISFWGFEWDYGGTARWSEGELELTLRLSPTPGWEESVGTEPDVNEIIGERMVSSDHPLIRRLTVLVRSLSLAGPEPSELQYECPF